MDGIRGIGKKQGGQTPPASARLPAAVFSAFFLCSCAYSKPVDSVPQRTPQPMFSSWERGTCSFSDPFVVYSESSSRVTGSLALDARPREPWRLLCAPDFTVIIGRTHAIIVALGGNGVLEGREMLGALSERLVAANSYSINIGPILDEDGGIRGARLESGRLRITSVAGRTWEITLSDPFAGWNIY